MTAILLFLHNSATYMVNQLVSIDKSCVETSRVATQAYNSDAVLPCATALLPPLHQHGRMAAEDQLVA